MSATQRTAAAATATIHESRVGTYHPPEGAEPAWTINDTQGYIDGGPACDECGACDCDDDAKRRHDEFEEEAECVGLSFAFVCLDGDESLCEVCAEREGIVIVPCDCEVAR